MADGAFLSTEEYSKIYHGYEVLANERDDARRIAKLLFNICRETETPLLSALEWPTWLEPVDE